MSPQTLLTVEEAAAELDLCAARIRQFCAQGRIGQKIGCQWLISPEEVRLFKQIDRPRGRPKSDSDDATSDDT